MRQGLKNTWIRSWQEKGWTIKKDGQPILWTMQAKGYPSAADQRKHYNYQFWLNGFSKEDTGRRWYPDVPADVYFANNYGGQKTLAFLAAVA